MARAVPKWVSGQSCRAVGENVNRSDEHKAKSVSHLRAWSVNVAAANGIWRAGRLLMSGVQSSRRGGLPSAERIHRDRATATTASHMARARRYSRVCDVGCERFQEEHTCVGGVGTSSGWASLIIWSPTLPAHS